MSIFAPVIDSAKIIFLNSSIWHGHSFLVFHVRSTCSITSQMIRALTNADAEVYSKIEYADSNRIPMYLNKTYMASCLKKTKLPMSTSVNMTIVGYMISFPDHTNTLHRDIRASELRSTSGLHPD